MTQTTEKRRIFTVSRLNQEVQQSLESGFGMLWLQGELSNFSKPASGHFYFSLKDSQAQIRCAMFKGRNRYVDFKPENGDEVLVRGKLGLYAARGDFQLIVEHMEPAGAGKLQMAFEERKRKLDALGWFDQKNKLALPAMPQTIGVVSSTTGAAIRDVLHVLSRRYPQASIVVYPTMVQGAAAVPEIVGAIGKANSRRETDVLLVVRGGGSLEDLWAFNDEAVAAAIRDCTIPVVSGVGHEVDITITDLVADLRAPTPSAAAELATPDGMALLAQAEQHAQALNRTLEARLRRLNESVKSLEARLVARHPKRQIDERSQRLDELQQRLQSSFASRHGFLVSRIDGLSRRLHTQSPNIKVQTMQTALVNVNGRLQASMQAQLVGARNRWQLAARSLDTVSPLATLERGFAVVKRGDAVITDASKLSAGDRISTQVARGTIHSDVSYVDSGSADTTADNSN